MVKQSKGLCKYCGKEYTKGGMLKHLAACRQREENLKECGGSKKCGYFQIVISGKYSKDYWLIVEINENAKLRELDQFLRDIWLECCGHLSAFEIKGIRYEIMPDQDVFWGEPAKSMNYKVKDVFSVGESILYEYDFGSTTDLVLKVHSYRQGGKKEETIVILSRNNPPEIVCSQCGTRQAQWINSERYYDEEPFWCEECLEEAEIEEEDWEILLPVCNSPRMGVCGYEGSEIYPDQFKPDDPKGRDSEEK